MPLATLAAQFALWTQLRDGRGGRLLWGAMAPSRGRDVRVHYPRSFTPRSASPRSPTAPRRFGPRCALAAGVSLLLFAPWLPHLVAQAGGEVRDWLPFSHSPFIIPRTLAAFVRGDGASADELSLWMVPVAFLLWRGMRRGGGGLALVLLLPLAIAYVASFTVNLFGARYFGGPSDRLGARRRGAAKRARSRAGGNRRGRAGASPSVLSRADQRRPGGRVVAGLVGAVEESRLAARPSSSRSGTAGTLSATPGPGV
jgi:hypothetical protein